MSFLKSKKIVETKNSQSLVGRANEDKSHGLIGMIRNPYVFATCAFASLGCIMYGYDQGVMGPILVNEVSLVCPAFESVTDSWKELPSSFSYPDRVNYPRMACVIPGTWCLGRRTPQRLPL